jgi:hypothetical protein
LKNLSLVCSWSFRFGSEKSIFGLIFCFDSSPCGLFSLLCRRIHPPGVCSAADFHSCGRLGPWSVFSVEAGLGLQRLPKTSPEAPAPLRRCFSPQQPPPGLLSHGLPELLVPGSSSSGVVLGLASLSKHRRLPIRFFVALPISLATSRRQPDLIVFERARVVFHLPQAPLEPWFLFSRASQR